LSPQAFSCLGLPGQSERFGSVTAPALAVKPRTAPGARDESRIK
jgi:hypothetical protein